jgi:hypothetical protein
MNSQIFYLTFILYIILRHHANSTYFTLGMLGGITDLYGLRFDGDGK